jgi:hypothetical protein
VGRLGRELDVLAALKDKRENCVRRCHNTRVKVKQYTLVFTPSPFYYLAEFSDRGEGIDVKSTELRVKRSYFLPSGRLVTLEGYRMHPKLYSVRRNRSGRFVSFIIHLQSHSPGSAGINRDQE